MCPQELDLHKGLVIHQTTIDTVMTNLPALYPYSIPFKCSLHVSHCIGKSAEIQPRCIAFARYP